METHGDPARERGATRPRRTYEVREEENIVTFRSADGKEFRRIPLDCITTVYEDWAPTRVIVEARLNETVASAHEDTIVSAPTPLAISKLLIGTSEARETGSDRHHDGARRGVTVLQRQDPAPYRRAELAAGLDASKRVEVAGLQFSPENRLGAFTPTHRSETDRACKGPAITTTRSEH